MVLFSHNFKPRLQDFFQITFITHESASDWHLTAFKITEARVFFCNISDSSSTLDSRVRIDIFWKILYPCIYTVSKENFNATHVMYQFMIQNSNRDLLSNNPLISQDTSCTIGLSVLIFIVHNSEVYQKERHLIKQVWERAKRV